MSKTPKFVEVKIPIESILTADVNKLVCNPVPGESIRWIFRVNNEADFFNYQEEEIGPWIHTYLTKYLADRYSWGRRTWRGFRYVPPIIKFGQLFRNMIHLLHQNTPELGQKYVEKSWTFTFRLYPDKVLDTGKEKHVWAAEFIQIK